MGVSEAAGCWDAVSTAAAAGCFASFNELALVAGAVAVAAASSAACFTASSAAFVKLKCSDTDAPPTEFVPGMDTTRCIRPVLLEFVEVQHIRAGGTKPSLSFSRLLGRLACMMD